MDRSQKLVLAFLATALAIILGMRLAAPDPLRRIWGMTSPQADGILICLTAFILLLATGVVRGWRWTFWLLLIAFAFGPVRVVQASLQLAGVIGTDVPTWYVAVQGLLGIAQTAIAIALIETYRRRGPWGIELTHHDR